MAVESVEEVEYRNSRHRNVQLGRLISGLVKDFLIAETEEHFGLFTGQKCFCTLTLLLHESKIATDLCKIFVKTHGFFFFFNLSVSISLL